MQKTAKVELILPSWMGTIAGILLIVSIASIAGLVVQARMIDQQTVRLMELHTTVDDFSTRLEELSKDRAVLRELQEWRVGITIASRSGWGAANRYIQQNPLPMPDGMTEEKWNKLSYTTSGQGN